MWRPKSETVNWEPIPGVAWREYSDEEFAGVSGAYDAQFSPDQSGSLSRWFEHVREKKSKGGDD
jgi:hypothetical protein